VARFAPTTLHPRTLHPMILRLFSLAFATVLLTLSACAPGTDGIVITGAARDDADQLADLGDEPIRVELPRVPVIALPDLSNIGQYDDLLQDRLGGLSLQPVDGVEVITAECSSGKVVLKGDQSSDVFDTEQLAAGSFTFEIDDATGAAQYYRKAGGVRTSITTNGDGSGTFVEAGSRHQLSIEAALDGAGRFYADNQGVITTVEANADGAGVYYERTDDALMTVTIGTDGSGALFDQRDAELLTVDVLPDGSGDLFMEQGDRSVTLRVRPDQSWELSQNSFAQSLTVKVLADGSGQYRQRGSGISISLDFDADGNTIYGDEPGPQVLVPAAPRFVVADRFPELGTLATIAPPCATVLRFDSQVLFEVNKHDILPAAAAVLAEVAPALIEADRALEINGHTDANGTDEHNQTLSQRRAQAVAAELRSMGVEVEMTINGFGESQPVAANYNADGTDNEAGQLQNRRVEIVIHGSGA